MPPIQLTDTSPEDDLEKDGFVLLVKEPLAVLAAQHLRLQHASQMHQHFLSEADTIRRQLDIIFKAAIESVTCPILLEPVKCLWTLGECGHSFSAYALHQLFQEAVRLELTHDLHDHMNIQSALREEGHPRYTAQILTRFKDLAVFRFAPSYKCPLCRTVITSVPVQFTQTMKAALGIISLIQSYTQEAVTIENGNGLTDVDWADYLIFKK